MRQKFIEISDDASHEIIAQAEYFRQQSHATNLQTRWELAAMETIRSLLSAPERGSLCNFQAPGLRGLRRISIQGFPKHSVFYFYVADEQLVRIVHVVHGARDLDSFFAE